MNPFDDDIDDKSTPPPVAKGGVVTLTTEQKAFVDANWDKMDLMEMVRYIFKDDTLKGTTREGRAVREYLVSKNYEYKTTGKVARGEIELTDDNKEFIANYCNEMKPYEIARVIFKDEKLHPASKESLAVQRFIQTVNPLIIKKDDEYTDVEYLPPKTFSKTLKRIAEITGQNLEEDKLNVKARKTIEKAMEFMNAPRFVHTLNNLKNVSERSIFESEYVRSVWDKPDLTTDEINLYISLTNEYVIQDRLHRITSKLNMLLENVTQDPDGKISIALSDAIKGKSEEYNQSMNRQLKFTNDLGGKRADRTAQQTARAKSLVSLVEAFRDEQERKNVVRLAELRRKAVKDEMERLENFDDWECRVFGITREEVLE